MPLRPSSHPYSRLRTIDQHHWQWRARNIGGLPGDGDRWSAMDGQPQDDGPENRQPFPSHRRAPMDDRSTSRMDGRETAAIAESSTSRGMERLFTPFPAVSQLLPVLQIHFRSHADIYTHFISLLYGILRHAGLSRALFQILPVSEFYFRSNTRDQKWSANKSVLLAPAIISLQCRLRASSHDWRDFAPIESKMAAKTTSGSAFLTANLNLSQPVSLHKIYFLIRIKEL